MTLFQKHIALPQQHGAWAIWLGPFAIGIGVSETALKPGLLWLALASLGGFFALQPLTLFVKVLARRRPRADLIPAAFWIIAYGLVTAIGAFGLILTGNGFLLWLGLAALPVLAWQMWLVARREERGQMGVEVVGAGVLCMATPAAVWADTGAMSPAGWWLFALCWLQAAGAIVYVYLRLEHRRMTTLPEWNERVKLARRSMLYSIANVIIAAALAAFGVAPPGIIAAFAAMLAESVYGGLARPGIGAKPSSIGVRQIIVTVLFAVLMIIAYRM
ncbi:MAG: hypothetical protein FJ030_12640 [Chloroflexi bacterium]|nr:hypothetical protein [Chloroflexota bacterium]